jgi:hypothetical protein
MYTYYHMKTDACYDIRNENTMFFSLIFSVNMVQHFLTIKIEHIRHQTIVICLVLETALSVDALNLNVNYLGISIF